MFRSLGFAAALTLALAYLLPAQARASDRTLPMRFDLRLQGPAETCGAKCQAWILASGAITADSGRDFQQFAQAHNIGRDLSNATVVLDSDGGSVLGAIALGREIRRLALTTTVGRIVDLTGSARDTPRATLSPRADCESMCAFVLLGGVNRVVPPDARVMVHQIWLGDRRDDPTAANYSAEDLVLVQRDIGRLAQYTAEMGASTELLGLALRIPPWEPMHSMTADELRRTRLTTDDAGVPAAAMVAAAPSAAEPQPVPRATSGLRAGPINDRLWAMVDRAGTAVLARHHPLTAEGEDIGSFDLAVACGAGGASYDVSYSERRHGGDHTVLPAELGAVSLRVGDTTAPLKLALSERRLNSDELISYAAGTVPAALIGAFASSGNHSLVIETESKGTSTVIRLGNTGAQLNLPRLAASCGKGVGDRADLAPIKKTGGLAAAQ
jgi:hypothetical protein